MEGLELRKAVLMVAGWTEKRHADNRWCNLHDEKGEFFVGGSGNVWDDAPDIESSVDAALQWLTLPDEYYWKLIGPNFGSYYVHIAEELETTWVSHAGSFDRQGFAPAMCKAYLQLKRG